MVHRRRFLEFVLCFLCAVACFAAACAEGEPGGEPSTSVPSNEPASNEPAVDGAQAAYLAEKKIHCPPAQSSDALPQRESNAKAVTTVRFDDLRLEVVSACSGCHLFPTESGGFTFQDNLHGSDIRTQGTTRYIPGLFDVGERMAKALVAGAMPPEPLPRETRAQNVALGGKIAEWVRAGRPEGTFVMTRDTSKGPLRLGHDVEVAMTNLGDCIPDALGVEPGADARFASTSSLPDKLSDTDLWSLDSYALSKQGTVAYAPSYPLWSDGAKKIRHVHIPLGPDKSRPSLGGGALNQEFRFPDNTRFYKTFLKPVRTVSGSVRWRKIETRLIVVRTPPASPTVGSYRWNDAEDEATLVTAPYRDGRPFKDTVFNVVSDETTLAVRKYAIPAKHRCGECHEGSSGGQFVLGFTPLQLRRRPEGEGGVLGPVGVDELSQGARFRKYGLWANTPSPEPGLESSGTVPPRNDRDVALQGYFVGNCAHCHNPSGFASRQDRRLLPFDLSAGMLYGLNLTARGVSSGLSRVVAGEPEKSELFARVANATSLAGAVAIEHMPLHTAGIDCRAVSLVGRWISGLPNYPSANPSAEERARADASAEARAASFTSSCAQTNDVDWLEEDFTEPTTYRPRRLDWNDVGQGIPAALKAATLTPSLASLAAISIPVGYWNKKPGCSFPDVTLPPDQRRPWMLTSGGDPKRPYGEVFTQTAGAFYFSTVCQKCHGARADGESGLAKMLSQQTGGLVRVANLRDGLFRQGGVTLPTFNTEQDGVVKNLAGNYMIWMASGGTNVTFPPAFTDLVGPYGPNMLNRIRAQFARLLPGASDPYPAYYQTYEIFERVATLDNPIVDGLGFNAEGLPIDNRSQQAWLDRAQTNAGWMLFAFFKEEAMQGRWPKTPNDCESVHVAP